MSLVIFVTQLVIPFTLLLWAEGMKKSGRLMGRAIVCTIILVFGASLAFILFTTTSFDSYVVVTKRGIPFSMAKLLAIGVFSLAFVTAAILWEKE